MTTDTLAIGCDISPTTDSIIADINRENMNWESALGDLIDTAFDVARWAIRCSRMRRRVLVLPVSRVSMVTLF